MSSMMLYNLVAAALMLFCAVDAATPNFNQFPECAYTPLKDGHNQLPKFANEFEIRTEVKWAETPDDLFTVSFESTGYYQLNGSRGATVITREGMESRFLYDFRTGVAFNIYSPRSYYCSPQQNLYESACSPFAYYVAEEAGYEKIQDKCHIQATPITQVKPMLNNTELPIVVRGIPVIKFKQCVWMAPTPAETATTPSPGTTNGDPSATDGTYWLMEYFYSKNDNMTTAGPRLPLNTVPVRLNATRLGYNSSALTQHQRSANGHKPRQLYDFFFYRTQIADKTVFDPPPGVHCHGWAQAGNRSLPKLPDQFSLATISVSSLNSSDIAHTRLSFDNRKKVVLFLTDTNDRWIYPRRASRVIGEMHTIVQDFSSGLSFDMTYNQCANVGAISKFAEDVRGDPRAPQSISMAQANEFFGAGDLFFTYMGKRMLNDAPAHVWIATKNSSSTDDFRFSRHGGERANVELLFYETNDPNARTGAAVSSSGSIISGPAPSTGNKFVPAAIIVYKFTSQYGQLQERSTSTVNFYSEDPIFWKTFDISECLANSTYVQDDAMIMALTLRETVHEHAARMPHMIGFQNALQDAIARKIGVSALRISDLLLEPFVANGTIRVWFTVLGWPSSIPGIYGKQASVQITPQDAFKRLNASLVKGDLPLLLNWTTWNESFVILKGTLRVVNATTVPQPGFEPQIIPLLPPGMMTAGGMEGGGPGPMGMPDHMTVYSGYTGGAMAGLAIAMLIIGAIGGIVGGFLLWKRQTGIAYQIYD